MSNFQESNVVRQASGTSAGGQFANKTHPANDGVGLAVDHGATTTRTAITDPDWPSGTEVEFTQLPDGNWLLEATNTRSVAEVSKHIVASSGANREYIDALMERHAADLCERMSQEDLYRPEWRVPGAGSHDLSYEDGHITSKLSYVASASRIEGGDISDPDFVAEVLDFDILSRLKAGDSYLPCVVG